MTYSNGKQPLTLEASKTYRSKYKGVHRWTASSSTAPLQSQICAIMVIKCRIVGQRPAVKQLSAATRFWIYFRRSSSEKPLSGRGGGRLSWSAFRGLSLSDLYFRTLSVVGTFLRDLGQSRCNRVILLPTYVSFRNIRFVITRARIALLGFRTYFYWLVSSAE